MIESKSFGSKAFKVINAIILILLAFSCFYPLWYTFCVSISSKAAAEGGLVTIYPIGSNVKSYSLIMGDSAFWNSFWISIKRVVIGTIWTMVVLIMMSYPLAKSKTEYKPRNVLMWILVFCMLFNGGTIPWFITVKNYGMIDTMAALVLAGSVPVFNVLLMMNFFRGIPGDLEEAARVDGAGPWRILWQIVVPCSKPVIATIVLFTSVGYWNEYFQGLVLMNKETNYPLQTYIRQISVQNKESNTKEDVSITDGIISKVTVTGKVDVIEHTASLNNGNSGGPLLNADNEVIGINEFIVGQKGYSIQINQIKELLDTYEIAYTDGATGASASTSNSNDAEETEEPDASTEEETTGEAEEEKATEPDADLVTALQSEITKAKKIDQKNYTEESAKVLDDTIGSAETVAANKKATNDQVTTATNDLKTAIDNLEEKSGPNMIMIAGIAAAVVVVIIVIVVIIVVSNGKKKKAAPAHNNMQRPNTPPTRPQPAPQQQPQYSPVDQGDSGTTLLNSGSGETTLLNGGGGSAYLIRRKNGEKIMITSQNFAIGKERRRVNYCVSDNTSVSRYHAIITKKGSDYYVADQKSSNFTYVNGVQLSPYQETLLTDRSTLKLSDEEFEFHLS